MVMQQRRPPRLPAAELSLIRTQAQNSSDRARSRQCAERSQYPRFRQDLAILLLAVITLQPTIACRWHEAYCSITRTERDIRE